MSTAFVFTPKIIQHMRKQFYLRNVYSPVLEESTCILSYNPKKHRLFKKLKNTFFSQIGSNPRHAEDEDYHLFDGDGMMHSIFFNETFITYQNKWIQTKRLRIENRWRRKMYLYFGELRGWKGIVQIFKFSMMQLLGFLPHARGTANTAMLEWKNRFYALHEGDMPYEISLNYEFPNIATLHRLNISKIHSTTAHPIIDKRRNLLYMYGYNNYDFIDGKFIFNIFDENMTHIKQHNISLINNGMVHDVGFTGNHIIIPDLPLKYDPSLILHEKLPMYFDKENGIARLGIFNVDTYNNPQWFSFDDKFFIFHFSKAYARKNEIVVFACVMDDLHMEDFVDLDSSPSNIVRGNIRLKRVHLNSSNNTTKIIENPYIEDLALDFPYNLDFPIISINDRRYIYCTIFDSTTGYIRGYIRSDTYKFESRKPSLFLFENGVYGNSEPQPVIIDNREYLLTFINENGVSSIAMIDILRNKIADKIEIPKRVPPGFHSLFMKHNER